jgi:hypothetical protein
MYSRWTRSYNQSAEDAQIPLTICSGSPQSLMQKRYNGALSTKAIRLPPLTIHLVPPSVLQSPRELQTASSPQLVVFLGEDGYKRLHHAHEVGQVVLGVGVTGVRSLYV